MSSHWRSIFAACRYGTGLAHSGGRDLSAQADFVRDSGRISLKEAELSRGRFSWFCLVSAFLYRTQSLLCSRSMKRVMRLD